MNASHSSYRPLGTFRFTLAMMVVLSHTFFLSLGASDGGFVQAMGLGNIAVMGFFVLSGFIIAEAVDLFYSGRIVPFLANRALRLIPPYWAALIVAVAVHAALAANGMLRLIDYATPPPDMFSWQNLLVQTTGIIPIANFNKIFSAHDWYYFVRFTWAVFVEFVFYLSMAATMLAWPLFRRMIGLRAYALMCAAEALAVHIVSEYVHVLHFSLAFIPYFVLGVSLYAILTRRDWLAYAVAAISYVLVAAHYLRYAQGKVPLSLMWAGLEQPGIVASVLAVLALPLLIIPLATLKVSDRAAQFDMRLGDLTYPLYLNHYVAIIAIWSLWRAPPPAAQLVVIAVALALALAMKLIVETPLAAVRNKLRGRPLLHTRSQRPALARSTA